MKSKSWVLFAVVLVCVATMTITGAGESRTLRGEYQWDQRDETGELEAVFTPTGEGAWDVEFHFEFRGKSHVYAGSAEGSLDEGDLSGKVFNEEKKRTFLFTGSFKDGTFRGTHAEIHGDDKQETGTLSLKR